MYSRLSVLAAVVTAFVLFPAFAADDKDSFDDEGFIKTWLLLAPIPLGDCVSGADGLAKEQIPGEANLKPKEGDKVRVGDTDLTWRKYTAKEYFFDFNGFLDKQVEDSVGYAVCYIEAPSELRGVQLKTGSDDQCKVWLNGKEVFRYTEPRAIDRDQDTTEVTLKQGMNTLVFKVVNEKIDWSGCARFTDKDGNVLRNLKIRLTPQ